jgi:HEPN domain-containing protein
MRRHSDWLRQAQRDLEHARRSQEAGDYEWACFAAQQAAEKALKALHLALDSYPEGAPLDFYTRQDAEEALHAAESVVKFCADHIARLAGGTP